MSSQPHACTWHDIALRIGNKPIAYEEHARPCKCSNAANAALLLPARTLSGHSCSLGTGDEGLLGDCGAVAARWLEEPSPWRWPPAPPDPGKGLHGVESRFGPHLPALGSPPGSPGSRLHWIRPATLAFASVHQDASLQVSGKLRVYPLQWPINWK